MTIHRAIHAVPDDGLGRMWADAHGVAIRVASASPTPISAGHLSRGWIDVGRFRPDRLPAAYEPVRVMILSTPGTDASGQSAH